MFARLMRRFTNSIAVAVVGDVGGGVVGGEPYFDCPGGVVPVVPPAGT